MASRPLVKQEATSFSLSVAVTPTPIAPQLGLTSMIDSFIVTIPSTAANSVFMGFDAGVTTTTGLELLAGTSENFRIDQGGRQLYELQFPLMDLRNDKLCKTDPLEQIPYVVWDMSQVYLVAAAITVVTIAVFKAVYV